MEKYKTCQQSKNLGAQHFKWVLKTKLLAGIGLVNLFNILKVVFV